CLNLILKNCLSLTHFMQPQQPLNEEKELNVVQENILKEVKPTVDETTPESALTVPPITKQFLRGAKQMIPNGNRFYFSDGISDVEIKIFSDDIIRVRLAPKGEFLDDFSYAIDES